jgi:hypothetical protein
MMRTFTINEEQLESMLRKVRLLSEYEARVDAFQAQFAYLISGFDKVLSQIETGTPDEPVSKSQMTFIDQETSDFLKDWINFIGPRDRGMEDGITGVF